MKNRAKLDLFQRETIRLFHNYLASAKSLIDHTRNFVREYYSTSIFQKDYLSKVNQTFNNPLCKFVVNLRDFFLHEGLPTSFASVHFEPDRPLEYGLFLDVSSLRKWKRWNYGSKEYLKTLGPEMELDVIVNEYGSIVIGFYEWFGRQLQTLHSIQFEELETLQKKYRELTQGDMIS